MGKRIFRKSSTVKPGKKKAKGNITFRLLINKILRIPQ